MTRRRSAPETGRAVRRIVLACGLAASNLIVIARSADAQTTQLIGVGGAYPVLSRDGRYVAFESGATDLVAGDSNGFLDVFLRDRQTGAIERLSVATDGAQAIGGHSTNAAISADGRYVTFASTASNLVANDTNGFADIFVRDRETQTTTCVSTAPSGAVAVGGHAFWPAMSADGRYIAFHSAATNLVAGDTNGVIDVFLHDRQTGATTLVSVPATGVANGNSMNPAISADGRFVAFDSMAVNLIAGDTNSARDVFVRDVQAGVTTRVSVGAGGTQAAGGSGFPGIDGSGRLVTFHSFAPNLVAGDTNAVNDIFLRDTQAGTTSLISAALGAPADRVSLFGRISGNGRYVAFVSEATNLVANDTNGVRDVFVHDREFGMTTRVSVASDGSQAAAESPADPAGLTESGTTVAFSSTANNLVTNDPNPASFDLFIRFGSPDDVDGDDLADEWETLFGVDARLAFGDAGPYGDPDGDGRTNLEEFVAGSHPRGFHTRYLAEGALNAFFDLRLAMLNVGPAPASVLTRLLQPGGGSVDFVEELPVLRRRTFGRAEIGDYAQILSDFSTVVESDQPIVVDRTMSWDASGYGSHAETAVASPSTTWYLAEGSTSGEFALFYLLQNPNPAATTATVRYLLPFGQTPIEKTYAMAGHSRLTIPVDDQGPEFVTTDVSAVISAPVPIIAERAMYFSRPGQPFAAGHGSTGVTAPATSWFLAEGATGPFFDLFILLANPNAQAADVTIDYLLLDGRTFSKSYNVPANGRSTVWVDDEQIPAGSGSKPLDNVAVSSTITASMPIIVERTMWWPSPALSANYWTEAHNSPGTTSTGTRWALAEGEVGGPLAAETYILIANTSASAGQARVTLYFEDGASVERTVDLPARSRTNVAVSTIPEAAGRRFAAIVESLGAAPAEIVVERAMYTSPGGVTWAAGTDALATKLP